MSYGTMLNYFLFDIGFLLQDGAAVWMCCGVATILTITSIVVAICICCSKRKDKLYGLFLNGMVLVSAIAMYIYVGAFGDYYCILFRYSYYSSYYYDICANWGNYTVVQCMLWVWSMQ